MVSLAHRPAVRPTAGTAHRLLTVGGSVTALGCLALWPMWSDDPVTAAINVLVAASFVTTGSILWDEESQRGNAKALVLCGLLWLVSWLNCWESGPFPLLSETVGYLWFVCGGLALLRYPEPLLSHRSERAYLIFLGVWVCGVQALSSLVSEPEWNGFAATAWWPAIWPDRDVADAVMTSFYLVTGVAVIVMLALLVRKLRRVRDVDRFDALPVTVAAASTALGGGVYMAINIVPHSPAAVDAVLLAIGLTALITPLAFLTVVVQRQLARSTIADLVVTVGMLAAPSVGAVEAELQKALRDPTLQLLLWLPTLEAYVDKDGASVEQLAGSGVWEVPVHGRDNQPLALIAVDPALRRQAKLVESAVVASGLALENGRLHADLQRQLREVRASRTRIVEAGMLERRRIERDLHDGAQQSLLAAAATLGIARLRSAADTEAIEAIDEARRNVKVALRDLRDLARGIHPAVLSQSGLRPALEGVAEGAAMPVELRIPDRRWSPPVESALYFVVCEALANVVKHAGATRAAVALGGGQDGDLVLTIEDDGRGGAVMGPGGGLGGIADRISALDGELTVHSRDGGGTTVTARVPGARSAR